MAADGQRRIVRIAVTPAECGRRVRGMLAEIGEIDLPAVRQLRPGADLEVRDRARIRVVAVLVIDAQPPVDQAGQGGGHIADFDGERLLHGRQVFVIQGHRLRGC